MKLRWFLSGTVREAMDMCSHVRKLLNVQRDLLSEEAVAAVDTAYRNTQNAIYEHADDNVLKARKDELETVANQWLRPYPHAEWRENVEVFLVAIAVAMAIRAFFLQPFKIPTGSMQPTLYGVEYEPIDQIPNALGRLWDACVHGSFYHRLIAEEDGQWREQQARAEREQARQQDGHGQEQERQRHRVPGKHQDPEERHQGQPEVDDAGHHGRDGEHRLRHR